MSESHGSLPLAAQWIKYVDCVWANLNPGLRSATCCGLFLQGKQLVLQQDEEILDLKGLNLKCFILTLLQCFQENGFDTLNPFGQLTRFRGYSIHISFNLMEFLPHTQKISVYSICILSLFFLFFFWSCHAFLKFCSALRWARLTADRHWADC